MTLHLALRFPVQNVDHVEVLIGAGSIETATGLSPRDIAELSTADKTAIYRMMTTSPFGRPTADFAQ